ncbi:MAG TPA: DUF6084 family protein [Acidobacteriaceae bacterium]|nr:DUF6084 family protein [Acidobacteriaceae bacterium]
MPDLTFHVGEVRAMPNAAVPTIAARLHITNAVANEAIQSIVLNCQLQLQPLGRPYSAAEEARLLDLFGERERWGQTMKPLHWMNLMAKVPPFTGETSVDLPLPCSLDFDVAANKYFYGLERGAITIDVMFSGTVFYADEHGAMRITQIPWDREARFLLPVETWRQAIDAHYPESAWLRLPRETFDRLYRYKVRCGIPMWPQVLDQLLDAAGQNDPVEEDLTRGVAQ